MLPSSIKTNGTLSTIHIHENKLIIGRLDGSIETFNLDNLNTSFQFKSHNSEFDYLESVEIGEKIAVVQAFNSGDGNLNYLSANEKTIKHWNLRFDRNEEGFVYKKSLLDLYLNKSNESDNEINSHENELNENILHEYELNENYLQKDNKMHENNLQKNNQTHEKNQTHENNQMYENNKTRETNGVFDKNLFDTDFEKNNLNLDKEVKHNEKNNIKEFNLKKENKFFSLDFNLPEIFTSLKRKNKNIVKIKNHLYKDYRNAHQYSLNDLKILPNTFSFISSDYLKINLWDIEQSQKFNLIDIKPEKYDDLSFVITNLSVSSNFTFLYSTSKGEIFSQDLRISPRSANTKIYRNFEGENPLRSICEIQVYDNFLASRDLKGVNILDLRKEGILKNFDMLKEKKIEEIVENGGIYEKIGMRRNKNLLITGGFENKLEIIDLKNLEKREIGVEREMVKHVELYNDFFIYGAGDRIYFY